MNPYLITLHCSDTENGKDISVDEIRRWHVEENGWDDIGYHFIITVDGKVHTGRPLNVQGAHVMGWNRDNIGICMVGLDKFYKVQFEALRYKLDGLLIFRDIDAWNIFAHHQFDKRKDCPGILINRILVWYLTRSDRALGPHLLEAAR